MKTYMLVCWWCTSLYECSPAMLCWFSVCQILCRAGGFGPLSLHWLQGMPYWAMQVTFGLIHPRMYLAFCSSPLVVGTRLVSVCSDCWAGCAVPRAALELGVHKPFIYTISPVLVWWTPQKSCSRQACIWIRLIRIDNILMVMYLTRD